MNFLKILFNHETLMKTQKEKMIRRRILWKVF